MYTCAYITDATESAASYELRDKNQINYMDG